jgi:2-polyprenyl-6-hydroxyphenyl methylase/3-demethylubiquinone-9 3-methyltransferase
LRWRLAQWLEIRWWQGYLARKKPTAYRRQKVAYWQRLLRQMRLQVPASAQLLDAGCGPAGIFLAFPDQAVDALDPLIEQYQARIAHFEQARHPLTHFLPIPLEALTVTAKYDYLFCLNAINHVGDWALSLDCLSRAAKPGATLLLGVDVHNKRWLKPLFRLLPGDALHPHQHERAEYRQALRARGWQIVQEHTWSEGLIFDYWLVRAVKSSPLVAAGSQA